LQRPRIRRGIASLTFIHSFIDRAQRCFFMSFAFSF
jgi:hypothetical protein